MKYIFIAEFERASYNGLKMSSFRLKSGQKSVHINQNQ